MRLSARPWVRPGCTVQSCAARLRRKPVTSFLVRAPCPAVRVVFGRWFRCFFMDSFFDFFFWLSTVGCTLGVPSALGTERWDGDFFFGVGLVWGSDGGWLDEGELWALFFFFFFCVVLLFTFTLRNSLPLFLFFLCAFSWRALRVFSRYLTGSGLPASRPQQPSDSRLTGWAPSPWVRFHALFLGRGVVAVVSEARIWPCSVPVFCFSFVYFLSCGLAFTLGVFVGVCRVVPFFFVWGCFFFFFFFLLERPFRFRRDYFVPKPVSP